MWDKRRDGHNNSGQGNSRNGFNRKKVGNGIFFSKARLNHLRANFADFFLVFWNKGRAEVANGAALTVFFFNGGFFDACDSTQTSSKRTKGTVYQINQGN